MSVEKNYSSFDFDRLDAAERMKIERSIYFEEGKADISALAALPLAELMRLREESAVLEQSVFKALQKQAAAWEEQAGKTLFLDKAIEYAKIPEAKHTANQWQAEEYRHVISNKVYQMSYHIYENTRYDRAAQKSIPYSWALSWSVRTNSPDNRRQAKIAGQDRKVFADKAAMEKYLNGRIKAYSHLFTELSPPIPQEYAQVFKVNGQLLPGYAVEGGKPVVETPPAKREPDKGKPEPAKNEPIKEETAKSETAPAERAAVPEAGAQEPRPVVPLVLTAEKPAEKLKEITDRLEQGITELFNSERYEEYLRVMARFHNYSFNNTMLIAIQKPDASLIAGFSAWKNNFQRNVMKGQKGIKILAPAPFKVKQETKKIDPQTQKPVIGKDGKPVTEEKEITVPAYKVVSVFDVSQTEGKELPDLAVSELTGDVDRYRDFFAALEKTSPVPIAFEKIEGGSHGYYHLKDKRIALDEGMSELQTLKTAIHEIAHAKLHDTNLTAPKDGQQPRADRRTREVEAESVAYTVCQHYGLDTSDYSFGYVAGWSSGKGLSELKGSLETIRKTAAEIINGIDGQLARLQKTQEKEQEAEKADRETPEEKTGLPEFIYKAEANPRSQSREDLYFLQAYIPQGDGRAKIGEVLYVGTPEKTVGLMQKLRAGELTQEDVKALYRKETKPEKGKRQATEKAAPPAEALTDLQKKAAAIAGRYEKLPVQDKIGIIAQAFGCKRGKIETSPCSGKWRGTSDMSIRFDNGMSLFIGNRSTPAAKTARVQDECVGSALIRYNPEIIQAAKEAAVAALMKQEARDNAIAAHKGLKPYTLLNVEFNDGTAEKGGGYMGWYYVTLAVDGKICSHLETGLNYAIMDGRAGEETRGRYYTAGALKETEVDYVFNNVGFSSASGLYSVPLRDDVRERAKEALARRTEAQPPEKQAGQSREENTFSIYQLKRGEETRGLRFEPFDRLRAAGHAVERANYEPVYTAPLAAGTSLEDIYTRFNIDHPKDFKGHSLSVSDIVVLHRDGRDTAHYVDSTGYKDVPGFLQEKQPQLAPDDLMTGEQIRTPRGAFPVTDMSRGQMEAAGYGFHHQSDDGKYFIMGNGTRAFAVAAGQPEKGNPLKHIEDTVEQNDNNFDGMINNTPTVEELEAKVKAGETISLVDLANAVKADKERGKKTKPEKKPSIRAQLKTDRERAAQKKQARSKSQDLERS